MIHWSSIVIHNFSRNLSESLHDLMMIQTGMDNFAGDVELLLHEQSRLNTDLQEGLTQTRMVAFSTLMPRLRQQEKHRVNCKSR